MTIDWNTRYAQRTRRMKGSAIRELLKVTEQPDFISFAGGLPAPEVFRTEEMAEAAGRILRDDGAVALQYSATEGYRPLREEIARWMRGEGLPVDVENVLITTGSQSGIDLVGKLFIDPGATVAVESPTYLAALQSWHAYEASFVGVPSDEGGLMVDALEEILFERRPTLLYCLPNFQNPSGVTLAADRRERVVALCRAAGVVLVEDDPYRDLRFGGDHLRRLMEIDATISGGERPYLGGVISLGTFSKILAPGLRVGWALAAPEVIRALTLAKQGTDLHTSTLDQMLAHEMLQSGTIARSTPVIARTYGERRDVMLAAMAEHFPAGTHWTQPDGGMFLWVTLPEEIDAAALLERSVAQRVAFVPGSAFHVDGGGANTMRLNFSNSSPERIREGIARIGREMVEMREGAGRHAISTAL
jgi:2-aminoadipate transaminase